MRILHVRISFKAFSLTDGTKREDADESTVEEIRPLV
jgi:hypothetical protein